MPMRIKIPLIIPDSAKVNASWGSLFHGAMMERMTSNLADELHRSSLKPWAQYIEIARDGNVSWHISTLTDEMTTLFETIFLAKPPEEIFLKQKGFSVVLGKPEILSQEGYKELSDLAFSCDKVRREATIHFHTPTTFKSNGSYVLFPSTDLIFNSLAQKWDAFSPDISLSDPDVRKHLGSHVSISRYHLHSAPFSVDGSWVTGFEGRIIIRIHGPEALVRVANLLLSFSKYSGIGIKTALGMGGMYYV